MEEKDRQITELQKPQEDFPGTVQKLSKFTLNAINIFIFNIRFITFGKNCD